jgi:hypothetical protein
MLPLIRAGHAMTRSDWLIVAIGSAVLILLVKSGAVIGKLLLRPDTFADIYAAMHELGLGTLLTTNAVAGMWSAF